MLDFIPLRPRRPLVVGVCLLSALLAGGCKTEISDKDLSFVAPDEAAALVRERKTLLGIGQEVSGAWVDPRAREEYRKGHIPGAIPMPLQNARIDYRILEKYAVVVVYGSSYNSPLAIAMSKTLMELGLEDVRTLRGGLGAWEAAGFEVETGDGPAGESE